MRMRAQEIEKKLRQVFNFLSYNQETIQLEKFDSINIKNELITVLGDVIIELIKSDNNLNYQQFVNLMIDKRKLEYINKAFELINGNVKTPAKKPLVKVKSKVT